jgi:N-acyl-D-aspartate/D-glutamate deacylase
MRPFRLLLPSLLLTSLVACGGGAPPPQLTPPQAIPEPVAEPETLPTPPEPSPSDVGYDLIIENGRIVDGTGAGWYYGDIAVQGDRIARMVPRGLLADEPAANRVDATGHVVAPGFIDIQSQSDGVLLTGDGRLISKVTQGITTEIMGESRTASPVNPSELPPAGADDPEDVVRNRRYSGPHGFDAWLHDMHTRGSSANLGSFLGAATVRSYARGAQMGPSTRVQLDTMKAVVARAMEDGAFGIASALIYPPGRFASTRELGEVASAMAPYGGLYITHMRSEADQLLEAIDEAIEIGQAGGVPIEIYHFKAFGRRNWNKAGPAIERIEAARAAGIDVQANMYPYAAASTGLTSCFPPWASADGKLFDNLADPEVRARMRAEMEDETGDWENLCTLSTPEGVMLVGLNKPENKRYASRYLSDIALELGKDWVDTALDLVLDEGQRISTVYFAMDEDNVRRQLQLPWIKIGTDAGGIDPDRASNPTHPRAYGTYPRILGRYVREEGVLELEDAVRKMTSAVAVRLSIPDRGILREGVYADIVIFDPETVIDRATFQEPHQLSEGMRDVFVNGVPVVRGGVHTGAKPGMIVRGPGWTGRDSGAR